MKHTARALTLTPVALALLSGCAGSTAAPLQLLPPVYASDSRHPATDSLPDDEVLSATHVALKTVAGAPGWEVRFSVKGTASGPFAGTFSARGEWGTFSATGWSFRESFTIASGPVRIPGRLAATGDTLADFSFGRHARFGPLALEYTADEDARGSALVTTIKRDAFSETLDDFIK
jgi:hypothetical protein